MVVLSQLGRSQTQNHARLDYDRIEGVEGCPTERELRDAIAARLGYDPFTGQATHHVKVRVVRRGAGIVGRLEIEGPRRGEREIASPSADCRELLDSLAVAIAIGIDPTSLTRVPVDSVSASASSGVPSPSSAPTLAPKPGSTPWAQEHPTETPSPAPLVTSRAPSPTWELSALAGPLMLLGELPATTLGVSAGAVLRRGWWETGLAGLVTSSGTRDGAGGGAIEASLVGLTLTPCVRMGMLSGCAIGSFGLLRAEGKGIDLPIRATKRFAGLGAGVGLAIPLGRNWEGRAHVDAMMPLNIIHFELNRQDTWTVPRLAGRLGCEVTVRF